MIRRRNFLATSAAIGLGQLGARAVFGQSTLADDTASVGKKRPPIVVFAKPLQHLPVDELAEKLQAIGVQGLEATLRKDGQIAPENFAEELGPLVEALAKCEQRILIAASDVNSASPDHQLQLKQFAKHEIPMFRMSYYRYDFSQPILPQLDEFSKQAAELASLCQSLGIKALYQNHAGKNYVGAALWDLQKVLSEIDPQHLAVALDIRHTALELTESWRAAYAMIRPHMGAVYVKDFAWINDKAENVPLGEGRAKPMFDQVLKDGLIGPLSLHVEYIDHRQAELQVQRWKAVESDVRTLKEWLSS